MEIFVYENGPFMVNSYLVVNKSQQRAFIIDPGYDINNLIKHIKDNNITPEAIVATHGHLDHVEGVNKVREIYNIPFYANQKDRELIDTVSVQAGMFGVYDPGKISIDKELPDSGEIEIAGLKLKLIYTPGHSKGSVSIMINDTVFTGDALFNMSIGRTDLPGGSYSELIGSIKEKLFTLPRDTKVLPGHGPETSIRREIEMNPFFR